MKKFFRLISVCLLAFPVISSAAIEAYEFKDEKMEAEYNQLINELRCLVCQNQNLAGSDAELAQDLRKQTHEMLMQGKSPNEVMQYMVDRYGDFVLYRPQFKSSTFLLWVGPFILVAIVLWLVIRRIRSRQKLDGPDDDNLQRAKDLLSSNKSNS
jgi:cytochrome c-type biogenesis protein CcmH